MFSFLHKTCFHINIKCIYSVKLSAPVGLSIHPQLLQFNSWSRLIVNNMHSPLICKVLQKGKELFSGSEWANVQQQSSQIQTFTGIIVRQPVSYSTGKLIRMLCAWKGEQLPSIHKWSRVLLLRYNNYCTYVILFQNLLHQPIMKFVPTTIKYLICILKKMISKN